MHCDAVKIGMRVETINLLILRNTTIDSLYLMVRAEGITGTIINPVPDYVGSFWYVRQDTSDEVGAYSFSEMEPV